MHGYRSLWVLPGELQRASLDSTGSRIHFAPSSNQQCGFCRCVSKALPNTVRLSISLHRVVWLSGPLGRTSWPCWDGCAQLLVCCAWEWSTCANTNHIVSALDVVGRVQVCWTMHTACPTSGSSTSACSLNLSMRWGPEAVLSCLPGAQHWAGCSA